MGFLKEAIAAYDAHRDEAHDAYAIYKTYCGGSPPPRVPGMDTVIRLAHRISLGYSPVESAAREYVYRWHLAIKTPDQCNATGRISHDPHDRDPWACVSIFGAPHTIGM